MLPNPMTLDDQVATLQVEHQTRPTARFIEQLVQDPRLGKLALVSSFGAESAVLLHLVAQVAPDLPILFIDTGKLFPETLAYQTELTAWLKLRDLRIIRPDLKDIHTEDPQGELHLTNPDRCCLLRKTLPLQKALRPFNAWISGRKRYQSGARTHLDYFENEHNQRIKINPLLHWTQQDVQHYIQQHQLPVHPLVAQGYPSIGCAPCTSPVHTGEDPRAGRWRNHAKQECGIHFVDNRLQRLSSPPSQLMP